MKILGIDIGFSSVKCAYGDSSSKEPTKLFKFPSIVGVMEKNEHIKDNRSFDYCDKSYYVGEDALQLPSESLTDIIEYNKLEFFAPLFLAYAIKKIGETPDMIVTGLSKAQITNSGYFKQKLLEFVVNSIRYKFDPKLVYVIPQGAGCKVCADIFGLLFDGNKTEYANVQNYIGIDGGFNTVDIYRVINGKTSAATFDGIENAGVMRIASKVQNLISEKHNKTITLHEANEIITSGRYKLRSETFDYTEEIQQIKKEYIMEMLNVIESKYGKVLDKCECIYFSGGASRLFKSCEINGINIIVPLRNNEYLNCIGQFLFGVDQVNKAKE